MLNLNLLRASAPCRQLAASLTVLAVAALPVCPQPQSRLAAAASASAALPTPVIVELFTSEGCSDCPPADTLLAQLTRTQPVPGAEIIPLEEHVNYWNHSGWADPFSSDTVTTRQSAYADRARSDEVYTPEMVVNGRQQFVGSDRSAALQAIRSDANAAQGSIGILSVQRTGNSVSFRVTVGGLANQPGAQLFTAVTEDDLVSHVGGGENGGRVLHHSAVVRAFDAAGDLSGQSSTLQERMPLASGWKPDQCKLVAFVQERGTGQILCATTASL